MDKLGGRAHVIKVETYSCGEPPRRKSNVSPQLGGLLTASCSKFNVHSEQIHAYAIWCLVMVYHFFAPVWSINPPPNNNWNLFVLLLRPSNKSTRNKCARDQKLKQRSMMLGFFGTHWWFQVKLLADGKKTLWPHHHPTIQANIHGSDHSRWIKLLAMCFSNACAERQSLLWFWRWTLKPTHR